MAASISNTLLPSLSRTQNKATFPSTHHTKFQPPPSIFPTQSSLSTPTTTCKALSKTNSSSPSIVKEEKKQEQEKHVADFWRALHGEYDWVGLLDPIMDPLLRSEVIRYGDMAQSCYDSFDYDPYSKYCGSCRYMLHNFFESLNMTHTGYTVTRYLYATANINLPNFFKRSRWPHRMWSKHANWVGYVAVSDDVTSRRLGRRDITVAWRGTVTRLEWVADLMSFLVPISSKHIPCPYPDVKVESGFLELYTDKERDCRYCKFSAREQVLTEVKSRRLPFSIIHSAASLCSSSGTAAGHPYSPERCGAATVISCAASVFTLPRPPGSTTSPRVLPAQLISLFSGATRSPSSSARRLSYPVRCSATFVFSGATRPPSSPVARSPSSLVLTCSSPNHRRPSYSFLLDFKSRTDRIVFKLW